MDNEVLEEMNYTRVPKPPTVPTKKTHEALRVHLMAPATSITSVSSFERPAPESERINASLVILIYSESLELRCPTTDLPELLSPNIPWRSEMDNNPRLPSVAYFLGLSTERVMLGWERTLLHLGST